MVAIASFYQFVPLPDGRDWQGRLRQRGEALGLKGTLLLAEEGINGTIAGEEGAIAALLDLLQGDPRFAALTVKWATAPTQPFQRFKVKWKREIVPLGHPQGDPRQGVGTYVAPQDWNGLLQDPAVTVIDARNQMEVAIGTFEGAIDPGIHAFRELPQYLDTHLDPQAQPQVALFCTGGIRCEKATAYLRQRGFEAVYHLQGGILNYLATVAPADSLWRGECFVFDDRVAVNHALEPGQYEICRACGYPLGPGDRQGDRYAPGLYCPHCYDHLTPEKYYRQRDRQRHHEQHHGYLL